MSTPVLNSSFFDDFLQRAKAKAQGGLTLAECGELWTEALDLLVAEATQFVTPGNEKKDWVLEQLADTFDQLAPSIPLPWFLAFFRPQIMARLRVLLLAIADGAIERTYQRLKPAPS